MLLALGALHADHTPSPYRSQVESSLFAFN